MMLQTESGSNCQLSRQYSYKNYNYLHDSIFVQSHIMLTNVAQLLQYYFIQ